MHSNYMPIDCTKSATWETVRPVKAPQSRKGQVKGSILMLALNLVPDLPIQINYMLNWYWTMVPFPAFGCLPNWSQRKSRIHPLLPSANEHICGVLGFSPYLETKLAPYSMHAPIWTPHCSALWVRGLLRSSRSPTKSMRCFAPSPAKSRRIPQLSLHAAPSSPSSVHASHPRSSSCILASRRPSRSSPTPHSRHRLIVTRIICSSALAPLVPTAFPSPMPFPVFWLFCSMLSRAKDSLWRARQQQPAHKESVRARYILVL